MNKTFKRLAFLLLSVIIFSCNDDFLTEELKGSLTSTDLKTDKDAVALVDGIYHSLLDNGWGYYSYGGMAYMTDGLTDVFKLGGSAGTRTANIETFQWQNENIAATNWSAAYKMISRANWAIKLINNMDESAFDEVEIKNSLLGEASFLRALGYFDLVGMFGGVPLLTEPTESDIPGYARSSASDVYAQVEGDLQFAINNLADVATPGKATKGAALGLMAKTQLRQGKWQEANGSLDALIALGTYDLYTAEGDDSYLKLFFESNKLDNEFIFCVLSLGQEYSIASNHHVKAFTPWDYDAGWGVVGIPPSLYYTIEPEDARRKVYFEEYTGIYGGDPKNSISRFGWAISRKFSSKNRDVSTDLNGATPHYSNYGISEMNVPILRYADVLLLKADVENYLNGPTGIAHDAINQVRNRAGLENLPTGISKTDFRDAVLKERAIELATEGHRKEDLIRHGLFESRMTQYLLDEEYPNPVTVTLHHQLLPIPRAEMDFNPNLEPNPSNDF
ncbi:MAG: hypothetical protein COB60_05850 [Flavobacteriaceae bacterium]|nr:MAG: hypothetical protein COB60_05850 [Flavobacteriaceae bacterium]